MFSLNVSGMGCGSCVSKITKAIQTLDQDARVEVDRAAGKVTVESTESAESIRELIQELGYAAQVSARALACRPTKSPVLRALSAREYW